MGVSGVIVGVGVVAGGTDVEVLVGKGENDGEAGVLAGDGDDGVGGPGVVDTGVSGTGVGATRAAATVSLPAELTNTFALSVA